MDESGVLTAQSGQRFFGIGLLKVDDTSVLYDRMVTLKAAAVSAIARRAAVSDYLMGKLNRKTLAESFTAHTPGYFSVWEFRPK
jgi:hypothetical protein